MILESINSEVVTASIIFRILRNNFVYKHVIEILY